MGQIRTLPFGSSPQWRWDRPSSFDTAPSFFLLSSFRVIAPAQSLAECTSSSVSASSSLRQFRVFNIPPPSIALIRSAPLLFSSQSSSAPMHKILHLAGVGRMQKSRIPTARAADSPSLCSPYLLVFCDERSLSKFPNAM